MNIEDTAEEEIKIFDMPSATTSMEMVIELKRLRGIEKAYNNIINEMFCDICSAEMTKCRC